MADFGEKLCRLRKENQLTQEELAKALGVSRSSVSMYERGEREPDFATLKKLSKYFMVGIASIMPDELLGDLIADIRPGILDYFGGDVQKALVFQEAELEDMRQESACRLHTISHSCAPVHAWSAPLVDAYVDAKRPTREAACNVLQIPYVEVDEEPMPETVPTAIFPSAAGIPVWVGSGDMEDREYPAGAVPKSTSFAIRISGDSMQPTIPDGAYVFVKQQPEVRNGEVGVFMLFDDAVCKRFYRDKNGVKLLSDNPKYDPIVIAKDTEGFGLVGKVLGHYVLD